MMTHRERLETAWAHREPDRVPIEFGLTALLRDDPRAGRLRALVDAHADNFHGTPGPAFGFFGFPYLGGREEIIEETAEYTRKRLVTETPAGTFTAITLHPAGCEDYHWEKRYITSTEELRALAETPREPLAHVDKAEWDAALARIGDDGLPLTFLQHPLGSLVRNATMEDVYTWLYDAPDLVHRYLSAYTEQMVDVLDRMLGAGMTANFATYAHEMLIPPWMGAALYDEFVMPYDRPLDAVIHRGGGRWRAHCHGRCMGFLERFAEVGITAVEPLEIPPTGDCDLAEAKRRVGDRLLLSGNIPTERFVTMTPAEVRDMVKAAIDAGAPGGGFTLAPSNGHGLQCTDEELARTIANCEAYMEAGLEFGGY
ncbi:MAG TPA: uroporphyrinogen decarboxylase family protein [Armatimonadota bacterium]|nr:uroporphyrinogen decarboxylase family protein [Armatimonadota bacterium]